MLSRVDPKLTAPQAFCICPTRELAIQNHLDLHAVLWLESYLVKWPKTFIVVSHAREFLNTLVTDILHLHGQKLIAYKGDYDTFERTREEQLKNQQKTFEANERVRDHTQNMEVLKKMGNYTGITSECAIPMDSSNYVPISKRAPVTAQVVIGTPGTINKWTTTKKLSTNYLKILVFDEANHMLAEISLIPSCFDDELVVHVSDCGLAPLISSVSESQGNLVLFQEENPKLVLLFILLTSVG